MVKQFVLGLPERFRDRALLVQPVTLRARDLLGLLDNTHLLEVESEGGEGITFSTYMTNVVESNIPQFARQYQSKHGEVPSFRLAFGSIVNGESIAATVYPTGEFDYDERYTAIGSGSLLAEHFLRDPYAHGLDIKAGRRFVGYIIQRVSEVDSNVESIDVRSIDTDGNVDHLEPQFKTALESSDVFDYDFRMHIDTHIAQIEQVTESFTVEEDMPEESASKSPRELILNSAVFVLPSYSISKWS